MNWCPLNEVNLAKFLCQCMPNYLAVPKDALVELLFCSKTIVSNKNGKPIVEDNTQGQHVVSPPVVRFDDWEMNEYCIEMQYYIWFDYVV